MFSENLRYLRKQAQHSQEYLAKQLNYKSFTTIQKWEDGTSKPSYAVIAKIASIYNVSVNDMMVEPFWTTLVPAEKKACATVTFFRSELADNGITDVKNIEFTLLVSDYDDWEGGNLLEQNFIYNP